jgi:hypothetical protein
MKLRLLDFIELSSCCVIRKDLSGLLGRWQRTGPSFLLAILEIIENIGLVGYQQYWGLQRNVEREVLQIHVRRIFLNNKSGIEQLQQFNFCIKQVGHLGDGYQEWVHQPIVQKESPRFFSNDFLEVCRLSP